MEMGKNCIKWHEAPGRQFNLDTEYVIIHQDFQYQSPPVVIRGYFIVDFNSKDKQQPCLN